MLIRARRYDTGAPVELTLQAGRVAAVKPIDASGLPEGVFVGPGLVDLQVNGYGGQEFNDPELTVDKAIQIARRMDADGVTRFFPTSTTHGAELLRHVMEVLGEAFETAPEFSRRAAGIHLEGPYLSPEDGPRGAHPLEHIRPPDWDEFQRLQEAARGRIRLLTLSPEYPQAPQFIRRAVAGGVVVSIGHTAANSEQIQAAVDAGATVSTHLGNGAHGQIRRHPNYIWDQLADDRLVACLIADGHHLPDAVLQSFVRGKTPQRIVLVSDITGMGGMPPGRYQTGLGDVEVLEDGRLVVAGQRQYLAGAALPITYGVTRIQRAAGVDRRTAIDMAATAPAQIFDLPVGGPTRDAVADLILFRQPPELDQPLEIVATVLGGELVYGSLPS